MQRNELEQLMVSQLYGELSLDDRRKLDDWLDAHPHDRAEFEDLRRTCDLLDRLHSPDDEAASNVDAIPIKRGSFRQWRNWALAAAACFALLFVAGTQGFVLQVGSFRAGIGPAVQSANLSSPDIKEIVRNELAERYLPTLNEVVQTVDSVQTSRELILQRQTAFEQSLIQLAAIQKIDRQKVERAIDELVDGLDERLSPYLVSARTAMYRRAAPTNQGMQ